MKFPLPVCSLLLFAAAHAHGAAPANRVGEAEVRETANGIPCFTISEREERRSGTPNFDAVTVSDAGGGRAVMWTMALPAPRTFPVTFSMCIPYAGRVQALPQTPAARLEPGKVYRVRIDARRGTDVAGPRAYDARFCLVRQRDGSVLVHHIGDADHEGRRRYGCLASDN
jgi:hypothetical protein